MGQKRHQRRQGFAGFFVGCARLTAYGLRCRKIGLALHGFVYWQRHCVLAKPLLGDKTLSRVHQLLQVLHPVSTFALGLVMLYQLAVV